MTRRRTFFCTLWIVYGMICLGGCQSDRGNSESNSKTTIDPNPNVTNATVLPPKFPIDPRDAFTGTWIIRKWQPDLTGAASVVPTHEERPPNVELTVGLGRILVAHAASSTSRPDISPMPCHWEENDTLAFDGNLRPAAYRVKILAGGRKMTWQAVGGSPRWFFSDYVELERK